MTITIAGTDLSQLAGKYIGETEKNLNAAFSPVAHHGAALLFDEGDSLFGKRTDVPMTEEQLHPGVFVTEVPFEAESIEGVPTSTAPAWTQSNQHEPGITLLQLCSWAGDAVCYRVHSDPIDPVAHVQSGPGVIGGLAVDARNTGGSPPVTVSPGLAIGADGRRIDPPPIAAMLRVPKL